MKFSKVRALFFPFPFLVYVSSLLCTFMVGCGIFGVELSCMDDSSLFLCGLSGIEEIWGKEFANFVMVLF